MLDFNEILLFWFGSSDENQMDESYLDFWFGEDLNMDDIIRDKYNAQIRMAGLGKLYTWFERPKSALALLLLLDQFSRRIYRGVHASYRYDEFALALCKRGLAIGLDHSLSPIERAFFFMPLMRSENIEDQEESLFRLSQLKIFESDYPLLRYFFEKSEKNYRIISLFGRFPHRNILKGRLSTPDELQWLRENGAKV